MLKKIKVVVFMGGPSAEREVSLISGKAVVGALSKKKYQIIPLVVGHDKKFVKELLATKPDVVFNALHGTFGEDGTVQGLLESMGIPYTGSGVLASALGMNKYLSRQIFAAYGIPVPKSLFFTAPQLRRMGDDVHSQVSAHLGYPCVVKPNASGSSVGVSMVRHPNQLVPALRVALKNDRAVLIEMYLGKQELTVPVMGTEKPRVLPAVEIVPSEEFFTYKAKYSGESREICPARFDEALLREAEQMALRAHRALGCRGITRTDMIIRNRKPIVLEINTLPGLTPESLVPKSAWAAGISFVRLCEQLIEEALSTQYEAISAASALR